MISHLRLLISSVTLGLACAVNLAHAQGVPNALNVAGELKSASGAPITNSLVNFRLEIWDRNLTCRLYSEEHLSEDLSVTQGRFSLVLGSGSSKQNFVSASGALNSAVFANPGAVPAFAGCPAGVTLASGDERHIRLSYDLGSGYATLTPDVALVSSAYAMVAGSLEGYHAADFLKVADTGSSALSQANTEYAFSAANWPRLKALLDGTSNQYLPTTPIAPIDFNNQRAINVATPVNANDVANKSYVDSNFGGKPLDVTAVGPMVGNGSTLLWDATANKWVAGTLNTTPTGTAGGALTGTYPNPQLANNVITSAQVKTTGIAVNRLLITDGITGANIEYAECSTPGYVHSWTALGWQCTSVASLSPVTSVAGKTGAVTLNPIDIAGLGTAAVRDHGTAAGQIPLLDASARLAAIDGSLLRNINAVQLQTRDVANVAPTTGQVLGWNGSAWTPVPAGVGTVTSITAANGLLGGVITSAGTLSVDTGTSALQIVQLNGSAQLPPVDGSLVKNVNAVKLQSRDVASTMPSSGQVLGYNGTTSAWEPMLASSGSVINIGSGVGLLGGPISTTGTLNVDVGSAALKIVQENANAQIAQLLGSVALPSYAFSNDTNTGVYSPGPDQLSLVTGGTAALNITANGNVGIGTTAPTGALDVYATGVNSALVIPRDTTANRPTGVNGMLRYNNTLNVMEGYIDGAWSALSSGSAAGTVTNVAGGVGILGGPITTNGTLSVDVGTGALKIVQENANAQIAQARGTAALPSYTFVGDTGAGLFSPAAGVLGTSIGGIEQWRTTSSGTGFGTTSPNAGVDVEANNGVTAGFSGGGTVPFTAGRNAGNFSGVSLGYWADGVNDVGGAILSRSGSTSDLIFANNQSNVLTERARITGAGRFGIGTSAPQAAFEVASLGTSSAILIPRDTTANRPGGVNGMLRYNNTLNVMEGYIAGAWSALSSGSAAGTVTNVAGGVGILGGPITTNGTLSVDVGSAANKIVQENVNAQIAQTLGTVALPTYSFAGDLNTGTFSPGADQLSLVTSGTARLQIDATGKVGIGEASAGSRLHVPWISGDSVATAYFGSNNGSNNQTAVSGQSWTGAGVVGASFSGQGITGQSNSAAGVFGESSTGAGVRGASSSSSSGYFQSAANTNTAPTLMVIQTGTSAADLQQWVDSSANVLMTVKSSGRVGIGTTIPLAGLEVATMGPASSILIPRDSTANRPTGVNGMLRYNNTLNVMEGFIAGAWSALSSGSSAGTVTNVAGGVGILGGPITTSGTLSVDVGSAANKIVQENVNAQIAQMLGSVAQPSYSFAGDLNTGVYSPGADQLELVSNGTAALSVAANGNVGIGTSNAVVALEVSGVKATGTALSIMQRSGSGNAIVGISAYGTGQPLLQFNQARGSAGSPTATQAFDNIGTVQAQGWSGTTTVGEAAMIANAEAAFTSTSAPTALLLQTTQGGATSSAERMRITGAGLVGIGTGNPQAQLDVVGLGTANSAIIVPRDTTANRPTGVNGMLRYNNTLNVMEGFIAGAWSALSSGSSAGTVTNVAGGVGILGGPITTNGTLSVDVGSAANKIVQENSNAQIAQTLGSVTLPSYSFAGDANTGFFSPGADQLSMVTNGTAALRINAAGLVGIGATPYTTLTVGVSGTANNMIAQDSTTGGSSFLQTSNGGNNVIQQQSSAAGGAISLMNSFVGSIKANGFDGASYQPATNIVSAVDGTPAAGSMPGRLMFQTSPDGSVSPVTRMRIDNQGRVAIGANAPQAGLDVATTGTIGSAIIVPRDTTANRPTGVNGMLRYNVSLNAMEAYVNNAWSSLATGAAGLANFTEAVNTATPNATNPVVSLVPNNAASNADIALIPKGQGALIAEIPDNATAGGTKRGAGAVDWQMARLVNTQVASGQQSTIGGGIGNSASGAYATVPGGNGNTSSGSSSFTVGSYSIASASTSIAIGNRAVASQSDAVALGLDVNASGTSAFAIGRGVTNIDQMANSISNSLAIGFNSTIATLFVGPSAGVGTFGSVGIGTTSPAAKLDVNGPTSTTATYEGVEAAYTASGTALTIADTLTAIRRVSLTGNATITLPAFTAPTGRMHSMTVFLKQDATGGRTVSFVGNGSDVIKWDSNVAPNISTGANKITIIQLLKPADEAVWYGSLTWRED